MWLILCNSQDRSALWAYRGLRALGLAPLELVSPEMLVCALRWEHWIGAEGVGSHVTLADGRVLRSEEIRGVLNRLEALPDGHLQRAAPGDLQYARNEIQALVTSWLHSLPSPVLNRPVPPGLAGRWRSEGEWMWLAAQAGLPTRPYREPGGSTGRTATGGPLQTVIAVAGQTAGAAAPPALLAGCRRLAALSECDLLGIDFSVRQGDPWLFAGASPLPDLRAGGSPLLGLLARALRGEAAWD